MSSAQQSIGQEWTLVISRGSLKGPEKRKGEGRRVKAWNFSVWLQLCEHVE